LGQNDEDSGPTPQCGRLWVLRIGLYELARPKEKADDWGWIIDHTMQLGTLKVLVIVGLRLSHWKQKGYGPLSHHDLQVVLMEPTSKSDGNLVQSQLEKAAKVTGIPRTILSDGCRELNKGIRQFRESHPEIASQQDLKHKLARLLEAELSHDSRWSEFLQSCSQIRQKSQQTEWAFLAPPATKEKARFMNLDELVKWAAKTRIFLDSPQFPETFVPTNDRLEELAGSLRQYDSALPEWHEMITLIDQSMEAVREEGYHGDLTKSLEKLLPTAKTPAGIRLKNGLLDFVTEQSAQAHQGEHLPGSSEVIESLIGKGKRLEGQNSKGGFTRMILGMAAAVARPTVGYIQQAFDQVRTNDVYKWASENLGPSIHSMRRQTLGLIKKEQIRDKLAIP